MFDKSYKCKTEIFLIHKLMNEKEEIKMKKFSFKKNVGLEVDGEYVADFDIRIDEVYLYVSSSEKIIRKEYGIVAVMSDGTELEKRKITNLNNLSYFRLWPEIVDADLTKNQRQLLETRLQETYMIAKKIKVLEINRNGFFQVDNKAAVLVLGEMIFKDISPDILIEIDPEISKLQWENRAPERMNIVIEFVTQYIMVSPGVSEILFAGTLLAAIKPFFVEAGLNTAVCINLYGKTHTYKSSLIRAFSYVRDWREQASSLINDRKKRVNEKIKRNFGFPFVLEDYHPTATGYDYAKQLSIIDSSIRNIENESYSAVIFITSEFLDGAESLQNRILQIESRDVDLKILTSLQKNNYMPTLIYYFVETLFNRREEVFNDIRTQYEELQGQRNLRIDDISIYLQIVVFLLEKYLFKQSEKLGFSELLKKALDEQRKKQYQHLKSFSLSEEERILMTIHNFLFAKKIYKISDAENYSGEMNEICAKNGNVYITRLALKYGIESNNNNFSMEKILKTLSEADVLKEDKDTRTTKFKGQRVYCIVIDNLREQYKYIEEKLNGPKEKIK